MTAVSALHADLADAARRWAVEAGNMVVRERASQPIETTTKSTATDMVTQFDRASEQLLLTRLRDERPDDAVVAEEGGRSDGTSGITWYIDPIDGTTNFLYGLRGWAVSIAAHDSDGPLVAAVYAPDLDELFTAQRGCGAALNGAAIRCRPDVELAIALVATGFAYVAHRRGEQAERLARMMPHVRDVRRMGAASLDICYVACGRLDGYFEEGLGPWDLAAGHLVALEAGCHVGDWHGGPARHDQVMVATPAVFEPLRGLIAASLG